MHTSRPPSLHKLHRDERGDIMVVTAVIVMLLLLFVFVYQFQSAMIHAAHLRSQKALDYGSSNGVVALPGAKVAARIAANTAEDVFANRVLTTGGRFSEITLPGNTSLRVVLPKYGVVSDGNSTTGKILVWDKDILGSGAYSDPTGSLTGSANEGVRNLLFGSGAGRYAAFDPAAPLGGGNFTDQIDDFGNAVAIYARFSPWRTFSLTPFAPEIEVASVSYIRPSMVYLLVDTMFSMDARNARSTFGTANYEAETGNTDPTHLQQWPLERTAYTMAGWRYSDMMANPDEYGGLSGYPQNASSPFCCVPPLPCTAGCVSAAVGDPYKQTVREFFFPLCRSAPFQHFLLGSVGVLDALQRVSSTASTTSVGLVPPYDSGVSDKVIAIHPAENNGGVWRHISPNNFPLPHRAGVAESNKFLHRPKSQAYHGWVSIDAPLTPSVAEPPVAPNSGVDIPQLCIGRAIATATSSNSLLPLAKDVGAVDPQDQDSPELTHGAAGDASLRIRSSGAASWCSDLTSGVQNYADFSYSRSSTSVEGLTGETARNMLAEQCMMVEPIDFFKVGKFSWNKPNNNTLKPYPRHVAPTIEYLADYLRDATNSYNDPSGANPYSRLRRIDDDQTFLVMSLYAPYNEAGVESYRVSHSLANANQARTAMATEFKEALSYALCGRKNDSTDKALAKKPINVVLAFHPMNQEDRDAVANVQTVLGKFNEYSQAQATGETAPTDISGCNEGVKVSTLYFVTIDYEAIGVDPSITDPDDIFREQVLKSSTLYMNMFPSIFVIPLVLRPGFAL